MPSIHTIVTTTGDPVEKWDDATRTYTDYRTNPDTVRPYTAGENADADERAAGETRAAVAATLAADAATDEAKIEQAIATLATLLADDTVTGSIRRVMGPSSAAAGTTSLRALRQQSNTAVINAASIKAFLGLSIDLAQLSIDNAQATRRIARQTLRLARLATGDYASADVGTDI